MSVVQNRILPATYLDSVALMRMSKEATAIDGVLQAALMMATPANKAILDNAGILVDASRDADPGDLIIAIECVEATVVQAAFDAVDSLLTTPKGSKSGEGKAYHPKTIREAVRQNPNANLALISVPGAYAAAEAQKALARGLNVMIFSDNVGIEEERALKDAAKASGRLVMGPDCGTAILQGVPIAFANAVPRGPVGIIGASGTGIQEISCLVAHAGSGVSHAIGTGGRDLKDEIGGITTLMAIDLLDADDATRDLVVISKPPSPAVAEKVIERLRQSPKNAIICFLGAQELDLPAGVTQAHSLEQAALMAAGGQIAGKSSEPLRAEGRIMGLYTGGTLCSEAQHILIEAGLSVQSNVPVPGAEIWHGSEQGHAHGLIDLGDDEYTQGRPHPMIEPEIRNAPMVQALNDPACGIVLLDCVLGYGSAMDPAQTIVDAMNQVSGERSLVIASVTGTEGDPQGLSAQRRKLEEAGVLVETSNAAAARLAAACLRL